MYSTGLDVNNKGVRVETTVVGINTTGVQDTLHEDKHNEDEDKYHEMRKISEEYIPEEDVHHPQITSPTEQMIYKLRQKNKEAPRSGKLRTCKDSAL